MGEIDLVARRGSLVAFVEVKLRARLEDALEALVPAQQARIGRAAEAWLQQRRAPPGWTIRFDLVALVPWRLPVHLTDVWRTPDPFDRQF